MPSALDRAKRSLVSLLKTLAGVYGVALNLTRDSTDQEVATAYRKLSRKTHPDRGGRPEHQTQLNNARDEWEEAKQQARGNHGGCRQRDTTASSSGLAPAREQKYTEKGFRFQGAGVLLTYQKFSDSGVWDAFVEFVSGSLLKWAVRYWCATMETNADGTFHLHLMLQFLRVAKAKWRNFKNVCVEVVKKKGAAARS